MISQEKINQRFEERQGDFFYQFSDGKTFNPDPIEKKKKKKKIKNFSLSLEPQPPNPDGQLAYSDIEHEDDIEDYSCHIPSEAKKSNRFTNEKNGISYEMGENGKWKRIVDSQEDTRQNILHEGTPFFDEKTQIGNHSFYVVPGEKVSEGLKIKAGEGRDYKFWSSNSGYLWIKDGKKGAWHRSVNRFHKKSDAQATFEEIRKWKPTQEEDTQATWEEFSEKKGYLYNGKVYKRCPKGTTGSGKTCVPKDLKEGKNPKRKLKKKKEKTDKQIELLVKAKSQKDIQRARKANRKKHDSKTE